MAVNPFAIFSDAPAEEAARRATAALQAGQKNYEAAAGSGREALTSNFMTATDYLSPFRDLGLTGTQAYAAGSGVLGPQAAQQAYQNFTVSPGYQFMQDEALRAVQRAGAAQGTATANVLDQVGRTSAGLAGQEWWKYLQAQSPFLNMGQGAAGGLANISTGLGTALAQNYQGVGANAQNVANAIAQAESNAALADYTAAGNMWNMGMNVAKLAMAPMTGGGSLMGGMGGATSPGAQFAASQAGGPATGWIPAPRLG